MTSTDTHNFSLFFFFFSKWKTVQNNILPWENTAYKDLCMRCPSETVPLNVESSWKCWFACVFATFLCWSWRVCLTLIMLPLAPFFYIYAEVKSCSLISLKKKFLLHFSVVSCIYSCISCKLYNSAPLFIKQYVLGLPSKLWW